MASLVESLPRIMGSLPMLQRLLQAVSTHTGEYRVSARAEDFAGWLLCDGRELSCDDYPELFGVMGTRFGSAPAGSFKLPDLRGRVTGAIGAGSGLTSRALGDAVGTETHTLSSGEMPSHTHTGTSATAGGHTHSTNATGGSLGLAVSDGTNTVVAVDSSPGELNVWTTPQALTMATAGDHTHTLTIASTGGGGSHQNMQPTLFVGSVFVFSGRP